MDDKQLRRQCQAHLRELELDTPFDMRSFCDRLSAQRGRPILLQPVADAEGGCGVWVSLPSADLIFYEQATSPLHQEHIVLHEVSHLLCGHQPVPVSEDEVSQLLFPHVYPDTVARILRRGGYSREEEREAEILASLILERVAPGSPAHPSASSAGDEVLHRLERSLGGET